jgi:hypothetical protein
MKNLFNNISQEEKSRILEMHSNKKNVMWEQVTDDNIISQIIKMDKDFDNDPLYKQYEKQYLRDKFRETLSAGNLGNMGEVSNEMIDMFISMGNKSGNDVNITPEMVINNKDKTIQHTITIRDMAAADNEFDLAIKLRDYIELLQKLE